jgi:nicotinamidase-related amidase
MKKIVLRILAAIGILLVLAFGYSMYIFHWMGIVSTGDKIQASAEKKPVLLVIDIQEGTSGTLSRSKGLIEQSGPLIEKVNGVIAEARAANVPVVYIKQVNTDFLLNAISGRKFLSVGTPSVEIDKRVNVVSSNIFPKQKMDAFSNPEVESFLKQQGANTLYVTGLDAAYCVDRTIKGALNRGYKVVAVKDAIISETEQKRDEKLADYEKEGVELTTTDKFLK